MPVTLTFLVAGDLPGMGADVTYRLPDGSVEQANGVTLPCSKPFTIKGQSAAVTAQNTGAVAVIVASIDLAGVALVAHESTRDYAVITTAAKC